MTTADAADEIMTILKVLPSPREAARALATAHLMLLQMEGVRTESDMRVRVGQSSQAVIDGFREMHGLQRPQ